MQKIRSTFEIYVDNNYEMLVTGSLQLKYNQHGTNMGNKVTNTRIQSATNLGVRKHDFSEWSSTCCNKTGSNRFALDRGIRLYSGS